jgi:hypothetical protein
MSTNQPDADDLVLALRRLGVDSPDLRHTDLRHCVHEASHALDARMRGPWSNKAVSVAMKRLGPGRAARSELLARAVEQLVCERLGVKTQSLEHWIGVSVLEAIQFRDPFLEYAQALEAANRMMKTTEASDRATEIIALAAPASRPKPRKQCAKCPWKTTTDPHDIPSGYSVDKHRALDRTIAEPGSLVSLGRSGLRMMACHETPSGEELPCVGWLVHQLGPGNNLALRMAAMAGRVDANVQTIGPQHERFEDTLPKRARTRARKGATKR